MYTHTHLHIVTHKHHNWNTLIVNEKQSSVPSVSSSPQHLFWYDWASSHWTRLGLCSPNRNRNHWLTQTDQTEKVISCNTIVYAPVRAGSHIWCRACDIAAPVVSSSADLQGADRLKVWSWRKTVKRTSGWFWPFTIKYEAWQHRCNSVCWQRCCHNSGLSIKRNNIKCCRCPLTLHMAGYSVCSHFLYLLHAKSNPGSVTQPQKGSNYKPCRLFMHTSHHTHQ